MGRADHLVIETEQLEEVDAGTGEYRAVSGDLAVVCLEDDITELGPLAEGVEARERARLVLGVLEEERQVRCLVLILLRVLQPLCKAK